MKTASSAPALFLFLKAVAWKTGGDFQKSISKGFFKGRFPNGYCKCWFPSGILQKLTREKGLHESSSAQAGLQKLICKGRYNRGFQTLIWQGVCKSWDTKGGFATSWYARGVLHSLILGKSMFVFWGGSKADFPMGFPKLMSQRVCKCWLPKRPFAIVAMVVGFALNLIGAFAKSWSARGLTNIDMPAGFGFRRWLPWELAKVILASDPTKLTRQGSSHKLICQGSLQNLICQGAG